MSDRENPYGCWTDTEKRHPWYDEAMECFYLENSTDERCNFCFRRSGAEAKRVAEKRLEEILGSIADLWWHRWGQHEIDSWVSVEARKILRESGYFDDI